MLQCMTDPEDVAEYLRDVKVEKLYINRLVKWLKTFDQTHTQSQSLLAVSPLLAWVPVEFPRPNIFFC